MGNDDVMAGVSWFLFVWTCLGVIGVVVSLLTGIQKLMESGWRDFVRALAWLLTIGWLLAIPYYALFGGSHVADCAVSLAASAVNVKPIADKPAHQQASEPPAEPSPIAAAVEIHSAPKTQPTDPKIAVVDSANDARSVAGPAVAKGPLLLAWPGAVPDRQPTPLPLQKTIFASSEVLFCPCCKAAYSSKGLRENVTCPACRNQVTLQNDSTKTVFRCVECRQLLKTTQTPRWPMLFIFRSPTKFEYFCPICNKNHLFEEH